MASYWRFISVILLYFMFNSTTSDWITSDYTLTEVSTAANHTVAGKEYTTTEVTTALYQGTPEIEAATTEYTTSGYHGVKPGKGFGYRCTFDSTMCFWSNTRTYEWVRHRGQRKSSNTGPLLNHTSQVGSYLHVETSLRYRNTYIARIIGPIIGPNIGPNHTNYCFSFWYNVYGSIFRQLNVYTKVGPPFNKTREVFTEEGGNQASRWKKAEITIESTRARQQIMIEGVGTSSTGDTAIDDTDLQVGSCKGYSYNCTFDTDMCGWKQNPNDDFDWTRRNRATLTPSTGPTFDHTTKRSYVGYYVYIETSSPRMYGDSAYIYGPFFRIDKGQTWCFSFWYNMFGHSIDTLTVFDTDGYYHLQSIWVKHGNQGTSWLKAWVNIHGDGLYRRIVIKGSRGRDYFGDIAIDDTSLSRGPCKDIAAPVVKTDVSGKDGVPKSNPTLSTGTVMIIVGAVLFFLCLLFVAFRSIKRLNQSRVSRLPERRDTRSSFQPLTITCSMREIDEARLRTHIREQTLTLSANPASSQETNQPDSQANSQEGNQFDPPDYETLFANSDPQEMEHTIENGRIPFTISLSSIDEQADDTSVSQPEITRSTAEDNLPPPAYDTLPKIYFRQGRVSMGIRSSSTNDQADDTSVSRPDVARDVDENEQPPPAFETLQ